MKMLGYQISWHRWKKRFRYVEGNRGRTKVRYRCVGNCKRWWSARSFSDVVEVPVTTKVPKHHHVTHTCRRTFWAHEFMAVHANSFQFGISSSLIHSIRFMRFRRVNHLRDLSDCWGSWTQTSSRSLGGGISNATSSRSTCKRIESTQYRRYLLPFAWQPVHRTRGCPREPMTLSIRMRLHPMPHTSCGPAVVPSPPTSRQPRQLPQPTLLSSTSLSIFHQSLIFAWPILSYCILLQPTPSNNSNHIVEMPPAGAAFVVRHPSSTWSQPQYVTFIWAMKLTQQAGQTQGPTETCYRQTAYGPEAGWSSS